MENSITQLRTVPIVAIRGSVVFPYTDTILSFGRTKSVAAVNAAFQEDRVVAIFTQKESTNPDPGIEDLHKIGTIATITQMMSTEGELHAMIKGQARISLVEAVSQEPYLIAKVSEVADLDSTGDDVTALSNKLTEIFKKAINLGKAAEVTLVMRILSGQVGPHELADSIASTLTSIKTKEKQKILEALSVRERLTKVIDYLTHEVNVLDIERTISVKTQKRFEDQMRKAMLRERMKAIRQELGEEDEEGGVDDLSDLDRKIKKAKMPKEVNEKALKEFKRLKQMSPHNPEGAYIRNYLEWLAEMPWTSTNSNNVSFDQAEKVLNGDHYGIEKVKQRILEYLAVMQLKNSGDKKNQDAHPTILCFIGPPGVGKTSIGKSIARSLGRKFVRVSLGGVRDEAEIRGHRRTYVGAMPGRIIQGIKNSGVKNPVFMLDEIDKLGSDFRGDPSSALLEALDPEQNKEFSDHYLEVPFDLSQVIFIATGNVLENIPAALRDRMEVIRFAGYIEDEKFHIAKNYLWEKQMKLHGINDKKIKISDSALREVIQKYTRESGVRNLERNMAEVCRKVARLVAEGKEFPKEISAENVRKYLGPRKFTSLITEKTDEVGIVTGLSVTSVGGEILFIEVALMPGTGKLTLTGQLGGVMKESAKAALTWVKAHWDLLGIDPTLAQKTDVHIHVPEGATPKDGPSAGVAMTTALTSAFTRIAIKRDVGMTGEVTLRGRVTEIGGVKEKVIAGHRAGLKTIILPSENEKDMEEVPENVKKDIKFVFAEEVEDALSVALVSWPPKGSVKHSERIPTSVFTSA